MQSLHKIFIVIQSHECRLSLWRLLHLNSLSTWFNPLSYLSYIMKSNFINIYFSNSLLKWLGLKLWITELIKLILRKYFISPLRDYEFHLENICSINTKCGCSTYWGFNHDFRSHSWYIKAKQPTPYNLVHYFLKSKSLCKYKSWDLLFIWKSLGE